MGPNEYQEDLHTLAVNRVSLFIPHENSYGLHGKGGGNFCAVIRLIVRYRIPKEAESALSFAAADPVVLHVHGFCLALNGGFFRYTHDSGVIALDGGFRLRPTHFDEVIPKCNHGLGTDE